MDKSHNMGIASTVTKMANNRTSLDSFRVNVAYIRSKRQDFGWKNKSKTAQDIKNTGSPYGYVALGPTITCLASTFIRVGGMVKKKATEDQFNE